MAGKIPVQAVGMRQRKPELVVFKVDTSATSAVADTNAGLASSDGFGKNHGTVQKTATGVYSIKLNRVARQMPLVVGWNARTVDARIQCVPQSDFQEIICTCEVNGTNTDMDFEVSLLCLYSDTEYKNIETQAVGWLKAHKQRDREDEKIRQDMHKILNRLALMGCSRHMPKKEK